MGLYVETPATFILLEISYIPMHNILLEFMMKGNLLELWLNYALSKRFCQNFWNVLCLGFLYKMIVNLWVS